jgi:hypothetical protein
MHQNGVSYFSSGTYTAVIPNSAGCDSTITIDLTINPITTTNITESTCSDYTAPDGAVYSATGTYTANVMSSSVCDSTVIIDLTVNAASSSTISEAVLDTYTVLVVTKRIHRVEHTLILFQMRMFVIVQLRLTLLLNIQVLTS